MKAKIIATGKSALDAELRVNAALCDPSIGKVLSVSDSGMRVIILYEEKIIAKPLPKKTKSGIIKRGK